MLKQVITFFQLICPSAKKKHTLKDRCGGQFYTTVKSVRKYTTVSDLRSTSRYFQKKIAAIHDLFSHPMACSSSIKKEITLALQMEHAKAVLV